MRTLMDLLMIVITTWIMIRSLALIIKYESRSIADYAILLLYVFQTLPVLCDIVIGQPDYASYLSELEKAISDNSVSMIYDAYITVVFTVLAWISQKNKLVYAKREQNLDSNIISGERDKYWLIVLILLPFVHILLEGHLFAYVLYDSPTRRGLPSEFAEWNGIFILISVASLSIWYFEKRLNFGRTLLFVLFAFMNMWISGKRYIVVTILFSMLYLYSMKEKNSKGSTKLLNFFVWTVGGTILYSAYYLVSTRGISAQWYNVYSNLRLDFGRDDVVKFSIMRRLLEGEAIVEYPGQSIISTFFMIVPRSIFPNKPYPHYRYLTAAIYDLPILEIPSGMTPTILEMGISNFGWLGMLLSIVFLAWYCNVVDCERSNRKKYVCAIVLVGMLTQSLDAMWPLFYLALYFIFSQRMRFVFGRDSRTQKLHAYIWWRLR